MATGSRRLIGPRTVRRARWRTDHLKGVQTCQRQTLKRPVSALLVLAALLLAPISSAASPSQAGVSWDYKLLGMLNSAQDPTTGLTMVISGSGSFDVSQPSINGGGTYTILNGGEALWAAAPGEPPGSTVSSP